MSKRVVHSFEELGRAQASKRVETAPESEYPWINRRRMVKSLMDAAIQEAFPQMELPLVPPPKEQSKVNQNKQAFDAFKEQFMKKDDES